MLAVLEPPSRSGWVPADRDALVARLRPAPAAPAASAAQAEPPIADLPELAPADRETWRRAAKLARDGDAQGAWDAGKPLFHAYSRVYKVQDLRCTLAMKVVGWPGAQAECDALMKLSAPR